MVDDFGGAHCKTAKSAEAFTKGHWLTAPKPLTPICAYLIRLWAIMKEM